MTNKEALLELLSDREWHSNGECAGVAGFRYGGRKHDLEQDGWIIDKRHVKGGRWDYRLVGRRYPAIDKEA